MIVLYVSAKVGHRQTTPIKKAALLNQDERLFYVNAPLVHLRREIA